MFFFGVCVVSECFHPPLKYHVIMKEYQDASPSEIGLSFAHSYLLYFIGVLEGFFVLFTLFILLDTLLSHV